MTARVDGIFKWHNLTSVPEINNPEIQIMIYPNPAQDLFYFYSSSDKFGVEVYNLVGQTIYKAKSY